MNIREVCEPGYYRKRVNEGEAAMRSNSGDAMWYGSKYRTREEEYMQQRTSGNTAEQLWFATLKAKLMPQTTEGILAASCTYCHDTGIATTGRAWCVCSKCNAYSTHAVFIAEEMGKLKRVGIYAGGAK